MCSLSISCGQLQVKTSTCHHTLKGYVMSMPKARMPIVFFLSRSVHNTSLRLLQFINLRLHVLFILGESQGQIFRVMYVYFTPIEEDKRKVLQHKTTSLVQMDISPVYTAQLYCAASFQDGLN